MKTKNQNFVKLISLIKINDQKQFYKLFKNDPDNFYKKIKELSIETEFPTDSLSYYQLKNIEKDFNISIYMDFLDLKMNMVQLDGDAYIPNSVHILDEDKMLKQYATMLNVQFKNEYFIEQIVDINKKMKRNIQNNGKKIISYFLNMLLIDPSAALNFIEKNSYILKKDDYFHKIENLFNHLENKSFIQFLNSLNLNMNNDLKIKEKPSYSMDIIFNLPQTKDDKKLINQTMKILSEIIDIYYFQVQTHQLSIFLPSSEYKIPITKLIEKVLSLNNCTENIHTIIKPLFESILIDSHLTIENDDKKHKKQKI